MKKRKIIQTKNTLDKEVDYVTTSTPDISGYVVYEKRSEFSWNTLNDLQKEVLEAREKHPINKNLFAALVEEIGEVAKDLQEGKESYRQEALQVAVVALRIFEEGEPSFEAKE